MAVNEAQVVKNAEGKAVHGSWYRGEHCNFSPSKTELRSKGGIGKYILPGWMPDKPIIEKTTPITAFGSCFAGHVSNYLTKRGYNVLTSRSNYKDDLNIKSSYIVRFGEGMVNSAVILQQFQWAYEGKKFDESLWFDKDKAFVDYDEDVRLKTREIFESTSFFVITLGLSEVWYSKLDNEVFWRAIPKDKFDPKKHGFKMLSVAENKKNLQEIHRLIRKYRGADCRLLFTLSPIPLAATFRDNSCLTSNAVSKASLRVAIDELMMENKDDRNLFYFPSYEIVTQFFKDPLQEDLRHPKPLVVNRIMRLFEKNFCKP